MKKAALILLVFTSFLANAQKSIKGKVKDLEELRNRELIVVLFDERTETIEYLNKKIKKSKNQKKRNEYQEELSFHIDFVDNVNETIKEIVPKYWKFNDKITFMTESEVFKLTKKKENKYAILYFRDESRELGFLYDWKTMNVKIPQFIYTGSERKIKEITVKNPNYRVHMYNVNYNFGIDKSPLAKANKTLEEHENDLTEEKPKFDRVFSKENMIITLMLAQKHMSKAIELDENITLDKFFIMKAKENCNKLDGKEVLIQSAIIHKKIIQNPSEHYKKGSIKMSSATEIANVVIDELDAIIAFPVLKKIIKSSSGGLITIKTVRGVYHKIYYNTSTGDIYGVNIAKGMLNTSEFTKKDFKKISDCKF